jgi:hypothetical protein
MQSTRKRWSDVRKQLLGLKKNIAEGSLHSSKEACSKRNGCPLGREVEQIHFIFPFE